MGPHCSITCLVAVRGSGFGGDIGVKFMRKFHYGGSDKIDDGHKLTASLSVVDIGAVKYKKDNHTLDVSGRGYLDGNILGKYKTKIDSIRAYAAQQGFLADTGNNATSVHLPTAMVIGADYQVYKRFAVNVTYIANLMNRQSIGNSVYNRLCITPRYDSRVFSVGLPISYSSLAKDMKVGLGIRLSGFIIGSDDMLAFLSDNMHGINVYFGGCIPIHRKDHKKKRGGESGQMDMLH